LPPEIANNQNNVGHAWPATTGGGGDFAEFMQCLNAAGPSPTAEDVTSCYDPIYGSGAGDEEASDEDDGDTQDDGNEGTADDGGG
jgi:hypothetical protein